jgi:hypothetical protein
MPKTYFDNKPRRHNFWCTTAQWFSIKRAAKKLNTEASPYLIDIHLKNIASNPHLDD